MNGTRVGASPVAVGLLALLSWLCAAPAWGQDANEEALRYSVRYEAHILPDQGSASVRLRVEQANSLLREVTFAIDPERHFDFASDEGLEVGERRVTWFVPETGGELRYTVRIDHLRDPARYDARCTPRWSLFRGEDLFPSARTRRLRESVGRFSLRLRVPPDWTVLTPYARSKNGRFAVRDPERAFDQPEGWILAGEVDVLREEIAGMKVTVSSPDGGGSRDRDRLALLRWVAPELRAILGELPKRLLVVGADDPMWRGGLSGPASIYLHADRPLLDRDWTSPLLHELMHVVMRARAGEGADWIVEGLAEYYSLELLRRSGTISDAHHEAALDALAKRGESVDSLNGDHAVGAVTAKAVSVFRALDRELRERSEGRRSLDDVVRALREDPDASGADRFRSLVNELAGSDLEPFWRRRAPSLLQASS